MVFGNGEGTKEECEAMYRQADKRAKPELSQSKIASVIMGVPGWSVNEPDATHCQIAHRIAREIIHELQSK